MPLYRKNVCYKKSKQANKALKKQNRKITQHYTNMGIGAVVKSDLFESAPLSGLLKTQNHVLSVLGKK